MATSKKPAAAAAAPDPEKIYHIVNPAGAIHQVDRAHAENRLRTVGWRMATAAEIAELGKRAGNQRAGEPICQPWAPDPDLAVDVDAAAEE